MKKVFFITVNIVILLTLLSISVSIAFSADASNVKIIETAGCNLAIFEETAQNTFSLQSTSSASNWFAAVFEGVSTGHPTTFSLRMEGTGVNETDNDLGKWSGLWPVYTYGKYLDYDTYIYYTKNADGYWVSSDVFAFDKLAGNNKTPIQAVIPVELAEEFLSEDGTYWSPWQEIKEHKINVGNKFFDVTKQFNASDIAFAMRVPYTYDYEKEYMSKLKEANISGVTLHEIGKSTEAHDLYVVEVSDPKASKEELQERRVVLMYADEDGNEPDGSWVVNGAMNYLLQGIKDNDTEVMKILSEVTFLFIHMLDPVGWSDSTYAKMTYDFKYEAKPVRPEVLAYANFVIDWCGEKENRLDVVVNLHNVECNEAPNVLCPILEANQVEEIDNLNKFLLLRLKELQDVHISNTYWILGGFSRNRLAGWAAHFWGNIQIAYEINSRYPENRLSLNDLDTLGKSFVLSFREYFNSEEYERAFLLMEKRRYAQMKLRKEMLPGYLRYSDMDDYRILGRGF